MKIPPIPRIPIHMLIHCKNLQHLVSVLQSADSVYPSQQRQGVNMHSAYCYPHYSVACTTDSLNPFILSLPRLSYLFFFKHTYLVCYKVLHKGSLSFLFFTCQLNCLWYQRLWDTSCERLLIPNLN